MFFAIFTVFFGFLLITGAPIYVSDTFQYENQMVMREPVYALIIQFLRFLSPQNHFWILIIIQNLLAIFANTAFMVFMKKQFKLNVIMSGLFIVILLTPHIMTPVFASTNLVLTNSLMTEGLLFSLYPLFIMLLLKAMWSGKPLGKESLITICFCLFMSLVRGQMMVLFVVWFLVMAAVEIFNKTDENNIKGKLKTLVVIAVLFVVVFVARIGIVRVYNYCENGLFVDTASGKAMSFANVLYVADRQDGEAIEDSFLRELFYEMYDAADKDKMNYKYSQKGLLNRAEYHEKCHDELNFTYFGEPAKRYVGETKGIYVEQYQELMIEIDKVADELSKQLMPEVFGKYVQNYFAIIILGFVRTVAYPHPLLAWYSLLIYIVAIIFTILLWKKNPYSKAAPLMAVVLLIIVGNVCATALMIQCISRYMIYNLPLFYMAGLLELREVYELVSQIKKEKK